MTSVSSLLSNHHDTSASELWEDFRGMQQRAACGAMKQHIMSTPAQYHSALVCLPCLPCCCWPELEAGERALFWVSHAHAE